MGITHVDREVWVEHVDLEVAAEVGRGLDRDADADGLKHGEYHVVGGGVVEGLGRRVVDERRGFVCLAKGDAALDAKLGDNDDDADNEKTMGNATKKMRSPIAATLIMTRIKTTITAITKVGTAMAATTKMTMTAMRKGTIHTRKMRTALPV